MILIGWRDLETLISEADIVLEVVEARNPTATRCKTVEKIVEKKGKDLIIVLNKCDLVPVKVCEAWVNYLKSSEGITATCFSNKVKETIGNLKRLIKLHAIASPTLVAVIGYPKVGKSSIINALKGKNSASTSPYPGSPGYTKVSQRYRIAPGIYLIDTPGVVPIYSEENVELQIRAKPIEKIDNPITLALKLINYILKNNRRAFIEAYGIESIDPIKIIEELARLRGWFIGKEREPNIFEAAKAVVRDYLKGKIRIYVMPPAMT